MSPLRPAEWMMLGLLLHGSVRILARAGVAGFLQGTLNSYSRGKYVALALLIVSVFKLLGSYRASRAATPPRFVRPLAVSLAICALPLVLGVWLQFSEIQLLDWSGARVIDYLAFSWPAVLFVGGLGAAGLLPWLFVARAISTSGTFAPGRVFRDGARAFLSLAREWWPAGLALPLYSWMDDVIGVPAHDFDALMRSLDTMLFMGLDPAVEIQRFEWRPLSEWLAFSYAFYGPFFPLALGAIYLRRGTLALREAVTALSCMFAVGFSLYMLVPVKGPALSQPLAMPVDLALLAEVKDLMDVQRFTWDCFPSLHTAGALLLSWVCFRHARGLFWFTLPMVISTPFACVYLRYHYVVDVLAGAVLALAVMWLTPRLRVARWPA